MPFIETRHGPHGETWTIARPERGNGLGTTLAAELMSRLAALESMKHEKLPATLTITARPLVKGERRTWIAGGDLKELATLATPTQGMTYARSLSEFLARLDRLPLPVIIAVDGAAIGGGAELALGGDLRIATRGSHYEFRQLKIGLATGYGGARRLVELVGLSRAQGWLYGCATVSAEEALAAGLVHRVVEDEVALATAVKETATELAALPREAVAGQKRMLWHATHEHPGAAREAELLEFAGLWGREAHAEALKAFLGRRG